MTALIAHARVGQPSPPIGGGRERLRQWSQPAVREIVRWALPRLEKQLAEEVQDHATGGAAQAELGATWIAAQVKEYRRRATAGELTAVDVSEATLAAARDALWAELSGLGRLQPLLDDPAVQDIQVNGCDRVWVVLDDGRRETMPPVADSDAALVERIQLVASRQAATPRPWDRAHPSLDLELASGHRLHATMVLARRPVVAIRNPGAHRLPRLADHVAVGSLSEEISRLLSAAVRARLNIVVSGGTGAGKTTLLGALLNEIDPRERIVTIEDTRELKIDEVTGLDGQLLHPNAVSLETRSANSEQAGEWTLADLLHISKRQSPDRVVVGEVRDVEANEMVDAMLGSAGGSLCTVHASSARSAIGRLRTLMIRESGLDARAALELLCDAVDLVVHVARDPIGGSRYVTEVVEVEVDREAGRALFHEAYGSEAGGRAERLAGPSHALIRRLAPFLDRRPRRPPSGNGQEGAR